MSDFFESGVEYDDATAYSAPEAIRTFRCEIVAKHPATGEPFAFGFMRSASYGWGGTGMGPDHWKQGWNRHEAPASAADSNKPTAGDRVRVSKGGYHHGCAGALIRTGPFAHEVLLDKDRHDGSGGIRVFTSDELERLVYGPGGIEWRAIEDGD